jgi:tetratricopeptide (TPR) repeat protein
LIQRGFAHAALRDYSSAVADFDAALKAEPRNTAALYGRGEVRRIERKWNEAAADYTAILAVEPRSPGV